MSKESARSRMIPLYRRLARLVGAYWNCVKSGNEEWKKRHHDKAIELVKEHLPSGSGIDSGTRLMVENSYPNKLFLEVAFHHMDEHGGYDGWTNHIITVEPDLELGFTLQVSGENRNDIKTYLGGLSGINLAATGTFDVTDAGGDIFYVEGEIVVRTSGASGTFVACGVQALGVPATVTAKPWFKASSAVNTTIANDLTISGTWSAQSASNSCRLDILSVDIID